MNMHTFNTFLSFLFSFVFHSVKKKHFITRYFANVIYVDDDLDLWFNQLIYFPLYHHVSQFRPLKPDKLVTKSIREKKSKNQIEREREREKTKEINEIDASEYNHAIHVTQRRSFRVISYGVFH